MSEPAVGVEQVSAEPADGEWQIAWRIRNLGHDPMAIASAWLPHGRFRSREWQLDPGLVVPAAGEALLDSRVAWREQPGTVVENGFLILRLAGWRVFARLTITALADGAPRAICEAVTLDRIRS